MPIDQKQLDCAWRRKRIYLFLFFKLKVQNFRFKATIQALIFQSALLLVIFYQVKQSQQVKSNRRLSYLFQLQQSFFKEFFAVQMAQSTKSKWTGDPKSTTRCQLSFPPCSVDLLCDAVERSVQQISALFLILALRSFPLTKLNSYAVESSFFNSKPVEHWRPSYSSPLVWLLARQLTSSSSLSSLL